MGEQPGELGRARSRELGEQVGAVRRLDLAQRRHRVVGRHRSDDGTGVGAEGREQASGGLRTCRGDGTRGALGPDGPQDLGAAGRGQGGGEMCELGAVETVNEGAGSPERERVTAI